MILKEHTRNQKRMYRIHKLEEQIEKNKYIIGKQQQQITQLTNNWNELEEWLQNEYNEWSTVDDEIIRAEARQCIEVLDKMKEIKEIKNDRKTNIIE